MLGQTSIARLEGRVFERVYTHDGRAFSAGMVHFLVRKSDAHPQLREYLGIQREKGALHFLLVPGPTYPTGAQADAVPQRLQREAAALFGPEFRITVEVVLRIDRTKRKKSYFSSELAPEKPT
jgi:hypothetical protein